MSQDLTIPDLQKILTPPPILENPAAVYLSTLESERSKKVMRADLNNIAKILGAPEHRNDQGEDYRCFAVNWGELQYRHTQFLRAALANRRNSRTGEPVSFHTVNRELTALRQVLDEAWQLGQIESADQYTKAQKLANVKGDSLLAGRDMTKGEMAAIVDACLRDETPLGIRDGALLCLMFSTGIPRAESPPWT